MTENCRDCSDHRGEPKVLVYACSGAANVAEVADLAARQLAQGDSCSMFCLAGIGAGIESMVETARGADVNLIIDGCAMDCGKVIFDRAGLTNHRQIRVTDLGIEKQPGRGAEEGQVRVTVDRAKRVLENETKEPRRHA